MDEVNTAKRLSEETGFWIDEIRHDDTDAIREIMFSCYSPVRNFGCTVSVSPSLISDKMFDTVGGKACDSERHHRRIIVTGYIITHHGGRHGSEVDS